MDRFNNVAEQQVGDKAKKCMEDAKCDAPIHKEGMHSVE